MVAAALVAPMSTGTAQAGPTIFSDSFGRSVGNGLGTADSGGRWVVEGNTGEYAVAGGYGRVEMPTPGYGKHAHVDGVWSDAVEVRARTAVESTPTGGGSYVSVVGRRRDADRDYRVKLRFHPDGRVTAALVRQDDVTAHVLDTAGTDVSFQTGGAVQVKLQVTGTSPTTLRAKVWEAGSGEPGWQLEASDSTGGYQDSGTIGLVTYQSGAEGATGQTVFVDDVVVESLDTGTATPPPAPPPPPAPVPRPAGRPGPDNTGVPAGTRLTDHWGDLVITTPGARYDALDVHGFVKVQAPNVKITRSIVRGGQASGNVGLVTVIHGNASGFVIEDSELVPAYPSVWLDALKGNNFTARRIDAHGTVDIVKVHGNNVRIEDSWLHDTRWFANDPNQGGRPTHNDGVQILGGDNIHVDGNTIYGGSNAALQVTQGYDEVTNATFTGNWVDGGNCTVQLNNIPRGWLTGIAVRDNRFGRSTTYRDCATIASDQVSVPITGNVWDDNGQPIPPLRRY